MDYCYILSILSCSMSDIRTCSVMMLKTEFATHAGDDGSGICVWEAPKYHS